MKIIKKIFSGILVIAACAALSVAQSKAGDKGAPSTSARTTTSNAANIPKGWQLYNLGSIDTFTVALPNKPEIESQDLKADGRTMKVSYYTASSEDIVTVIADVFNLAIESDRLSEENKLYLFKKVRAGLSEGMKSGLEKTGLKPEIKFNTQKNITLKGISGYEQDLTVGPIKGRARMLSTKDHIYIFFTLLLDESKETLIDDFLDSFEYVGGR